MSQKKNSSIEKAQKQLEKRIEQQKAISDFGLYALKTREPKSVFNKATKVLQKNLDIDFAKVLKYRRKQKDLLLIAGTGWRKEVIPGKTSLETGRKSQAGYTLTREKPVLMKDLDTDDRFDGPEMLKSHGVKSGMSVIIQLPDKKKFGVLGVHSKKAQFFTTNDINFLQSIANILSTSIAQDNDKKKLEKTTARLESAQDSGGVGIFEWNLKTDEVWWTDTMRAIFGVKKKRLTANDWRKKILPDDQEDVENEIQNAIKNQTDGEFEFRILYSKNEIRWVRANAVVDFDRNGNARCIRGIAYEITYRKNLENALLFRAHISKILGSSLDFHRTLTSIARVTVPSIADWCAIDLVNDNNEIELFDVMHKDKNKIQWAKKLRKKYPPDPHAESGVYNVIKTGESEYYPEVTDQMLKASSKNEEQYKIAKKIGINSAIIVPLKVLYKTIGAITLVTAESHRKYTPLDLEVAQELSRSASLAIENAQLYSSVEGERERLTTLLSSTPGVFWEAWEAPDETGRRVNYVSDNVKDVLGYTKDEWLEVPDFWLKCVHPEDRNKAKKTASRLFQTGKSGVNRFRWIKKDGGIIWVEAHSSVVTNQKGETIGMRGIDMDITDRMEIESRKDEFISLASHELKTPLTSLKVYNHIFSKKMKQQNDQKLIEPLEKMENQIDKLSGLINDLLDLSRIQAGKLLYKKEQVNFDQFTKEIVENMKNTTTTHKINYKCTTKTKLYIDQNRIGQVIQNFLSNSIKYSPEGTKIWVEVTKKDEDINISVKDEGKGIPKKHQKRIFERFYQIDKEDTRTTSGLGIGLYICAEIVKKHNGTIGVTSNEGKGATFYFSLPIANKILTDDKKN